MCNKNINDDFGLWLVPGLISLRILDQFKYFLIFILFGIFVDNKLKRVGIKKVSLVKFWNILDIFNTAKTGPGSKMHDRVRY